MTTTRKSRDVSSGLPVSSFMTRNLTVVTPGDTVAEVLNLLVENHLTGLPVIDERGTCIGVISATDILGFESEQIAEVDEIRQQRSLQFDHQTGRWESLHASNFALEQIGHVPVSEIMNANVVSVREDASVVEVARTMVEAEIHRVFVVDRTQRLAGSVSAIDIVRLVADGMLGQMK